MKNISVILITTFFLLILISCSVNNDKPKGTNAYISEIEEWRTKRIENLKKENGWLNLVGLYWLKEGENKFGSGANNDLVFPEFAPEIIGTIFKLDSTINFKSSENVDVKFNGSTISEIEMKSDMTGNPTILEWNSLRWFLIKRGDKFGIRLRDLNADLVNNFPGINNFVVNEDWKISSKFVPFDEPKKIAIPTIIGTVEEELSPGKLIFKIDNKEYSLTPTSAGERLFIVFADLTSGEETYGAGRFLYVDKPDSNNNAIIDFNKAYNPPCAFTKYATCPLPPDENKLRVRITAGEKNFGAGH